MKIWKLLLLLYLFSVLLSIVLSFAFILFTVKGQWDSHLVPSTLVGALFLNFPLTLLWIPGLFMSINFKNEKNKAFIACFITPIAILGYLLFGAKLQYGDKEFYATLVISQIVVLCFMFSRRLTLIILLKKNEIALILFFDIVIKALSKLLHYFALAYKVQPTGYAQKTFNYESTRQATL